MLKLKPFHETIVVAIKDASTTGLACLASLIKTTKIPKGHDEIIVAWNERRKKLFCEDEDLGVPANLLEQKQAISAESDGEKKS